MTAVCTPPITTMYCGRGRRLSPSAKPPLKRHVIGQQGADDIGIEPGVAGPFVGDVQTDAERPRVSRRDLQLFFVGFRTVGGLGFLKRAGERGVPVPIGQSQRRRHVGAVLVRGSLRVTEQDVFGQRLDGDVADLEFVGPTEREAAFIVGVLGNNALITPL